MSDDRTRSDGLETGELTAQKCAEGMMQATKQKR